MNNQEIIEMLYGIRANNLNLDDTYTKFKYDALNEAIKAIKKLDVTTSGHMGCFEKTEAKYIAYYIPKSEEVHLIDVKKLRTYIHSIQPEPKNMGDNAMGFLLPIEDLKKNKVIVTTYEGVI